MFKYAKWISSSVPTNENTLYRFKKTVNINNTQNVIADIFADSRYKLYINGTYICEGPCIGTESYYDSIVIDDYLTDGENVIEACVLYLGSGVGASCIKRKNRVAFAFEIYQNGETLEITDDTWESAIDKSYTFYLDKIHPNGFLNERYDKKELEWQKAEILPYGYGDELWGVLPYFDLKERPIKMYTPFNCDSMTISKTNIGINLKKGETGYIDYEIGRHKVGYPEFEFSGSADIRITYAESYAFAEDDGRYTKNVRSDKSGDIFGASDELAIRENNFVFRPFFIKTARYIRIEVNALSDFSINRAEFMEYRYPLEIKNNFVCSDELYNRIFEVSVNTLENCTFDTYVDCPYYEMQQYSEDAYLEMMYTFMLTDDYSMAKKLICDLWQSVNYEGMQLAAAPMEYRQITPTFCFFWIMMIEKYILYTGDNKTIKPMLSGIYSILFWFANFIDEDGVVGVYKYGKFIDWVETWKNTFTIDDADTRPTSIASFMYMYSLKAGAKVFKGFGKDGIADDLMKEYESLKNSVNKTFYDEKEKLYRDTKSGGFSEHSQIWAVLSEAVVGKDAENLLIISRENENVHRCSYSYQFFKNRAHDVCGIHLDMDKFLSDWKEMLLLDATTWFESPGNARSDCHAWSSVPIYEFTTKILGVEPIEDGFTKVRINPQFENLESARGKVPTPYGEIFVSWIKENDKIKLEVKSPTEIEKNIISEGKAVKISNESEIVIHYTI